MCTQIGELMYCNLPADVFGCLAGFFYLTVIVTYARPHPSPPYSYYLSLYYVTPRSHLNAGQERESEREVY